MIDFHNHILPGIDDGSVSMEMTLSMLKTAADQGITDVVNTVHFQHPKVEGKDISYEICKSAIKNIEKELKKAGISIHLHLGAEVFYLPNLVSLIENPLCTMGKGKYMLVEFQIHQLPPYYEKILFDLKMAGVTPIIAHPERYRQIQEDTSILEKLITSGCLVQVDAGSLTGSLGSAAKEAATQILKKGLCQILGSDAHDDRKRNFCLPEALTIAESIAGSTLDDLVNTNPRKVLSGEPISVDLDYLFSIKKPTLVERLKSRWNV